MNIYLLAVIFGVLWFIQLLCNRAMIRFMRATNQRLALLERNPRDG